MASELVANCPRCGARQMTFDVRDSALVGKGPSGYEWYEAFSVCRFCARATIFFVEESRTGCKRRETTGEIVPPHQHYRHLYELRYPISLADIETAQPPEELPDDVEGVFREATKCAAVGCYNAAGAMFRLCLDLTAKHFELRKGLLVQRLGKLCEQKSVPGELRELMVVVREDGNDGAHDGTLDKESAEDMGEFTARLLTHLFTEPAKVKAAKERRAQRKKKEPSAAR